MNPRLVKDSFYLSEPGKIENLLNYCDLSEDEVESIVGRFKNDHYRFAGCLKGEVFLGLDGTVEIRHHFKKKLLWSNKC